MNKPILLVLVLLLLPSFAQAFEDDDRLEIMANGLSKPWSFVFLSNHSVLLTEKSGSVLLLNFNEKTKSKLSNSPLSNEYGQGGLLDIAIHPQFKQNQWVYFSFSKRDDTGIGVEVVRAKLNGSVFTNHELIFKQLPKLSSDHHFGGRLAFDDQGFLFISLGDRGEKDQAQMPHHHIGKVIRIYDDGRIPKDNPYVSNQLFAPEVFSFGHRNVQGLAFNAQTKTLWSHEHGPQGGDEINVITAGKNYGWPVITYGVNYFIGTKIGEGTHKQGMEQPLYYWVPSIAPSGMTFCDCEKYPKWRNSLFVGSLKFSTLVRLSMREQKIITEDRLFKGVGRVRDVKTSPDGLLYFIADDKLYKIKPK
jgi:aldose sugar dehydrogenase